MLQPLGIWGDDTIRAIIECSWVSSDLSVQLGGFAHERGRESRGTRASFETGSCRDCVPSTYLWCALSPEPLRSDQLRRSQQSVDRRALAPGRAWNLSLTVGHSAFRVLLALRVDADSGRLASGSRRREGGLCRRIFSLDRCNWCHRDPSRVYRSTDHPHRPRYRRIRGISVLRQSPGCSFQGGEPRLCQRHDYGRGGSRSFIWNARGRRSGWPLWLASILPGAGIRGTHLVAALDDLDARPTAQRHQNHCLQIRLSRYLLPSVCVGYMHRSVRDQLLPLFSCDVVAVLPGPRATSLVDPNGARRCTRVFHVGDLSHGDWQTVRPLDSRGRFDHESPQRIHVGGTCWHRDSVLPDRARQRLDLLRDARADRSFPRHEHV